LALRDDDGAEREFDLGGNADPTLAEYLAALRAVRTPKPAWRIALPDAPTRLVAHLCDLLHLTPFSFGHWELLQRDNRPRHNALPALLGRAPRAIGETPARDASTMRPVWADSGET
jgi:NADH dehydrogenase